MLSPSQYAERISKPYSTVMAWLIQGRIIGAEKKTVGKISLWLIPANAAVTLPKMGRPKQNEKNEVKPKKQRNRSKKNVRSSKKGGAAK